MAGGTVMKPHYLDVYSTPERYAFKAARAARQLRWFHAAYWHLHRDRPDLTAFAGRHRGQRCFIIGGGPSLKLVDPAPLRDEFTFAVNGIFLIYDWLGFEPTYYVVEDFLVFQDRWRDILRNVRSSTCFFPDQFRHPEFDRDSHHYFRAIYEFDPRAGFPAFSLNPARLMWIGGTVTYICMQLAFYMGFDEVFLVGMDHNYVRPAHVESEGQVWTSHGDDPNHFHPQYFGAGYRWHDPQVDRMETAYRKAHAVYTAAGRRLANATVGGRLEVFERVDYARLFD
ncbi:MAG: 6-hydroxymethylpterin diphosphokinase MptE-like protein [Gammaproteobacteria bacterium]